MGWLLLFLVLLAAAFGILGAVLKAVVFVVLTLVLTVVVLSMLAWWLVKRQARRFVRDFDARTGEERSRGGRQGGGPELPRTHDDRY
jgi:peptidoglycan/LPS O-acetylase OafA/YrhL